MNVLTAWSVSDLVKIVTPISVSLRPLAAHAGHALGALFPDANQANYNAYKKYILGQNPNRWHTFSTDLLISTFFCAPQARGGKKKS